MGDNGCLIDVASSSTGNTNGVSGSIGVGSRGTPVAGGGYTTTFTFNNVQLTARSYQVTFDSTVGNSAYRSGSSTSVTNGTITIHGYNEQNSRFAPYSNGGNIFEAMEVSVTYTN
jgi:hypothetical protein